MIDFLKRLTIKQVTVLAILLVAGISMFVIGLFNLPYIITGKADNLNDIVMSGEEPQKLDIVELDVKYVLCCYAHSETGYRSIRTKKYHYVVMLEDGSCMSLAVKDDEIRANLSQLMSATKSYMNGYTVQFPEPLHVTAVVKGLKNAAVDMYLDGIRVYDISSDDIIMLELDATKTREALTIILLLGVVLMIVGIVYVKNTAEEKKTKARSFAALENEVNYDPLKTFANKNEINTDKVTDTISTNGSTDGSIDGRISEQQLSDTKTTTSDSTSTSKFSLKKD